MYDCNNIKVDIAKNYAIAAAENFTCSSYRIIYNEIVCGNINKPNGVSISRYAAMIRSIIKNGDSLWERNVQ